MGFHVELANRVLQQIEEHPETWNQTVWSCGTAHCFAGWAAWFANGPFEVEKVCDEKYKHRHVEECYKVFRNGEYIDVGDEAEKALCINNKQSDLLFFGMRTLADLKRIVARLSAEAVND